MHATENCYNQDKEAKAKAKRLRNDIAILERRIETIQRLTDSIGGVITELEAKALILQKHHDLVAEQLNRYLSAEKRDLLGVFESLYEKYSQAANVIEAERQKTLSDLGNFLQSLTYIDAP